MIYNIEGIGDVFSITNYNITTIDKVWNSVYNSVKNGEDVPNPVIHLANTAGYALEFEKYIRLSEDKDVYDTVLDALALMTQDELRKPPMLTYDEDFLINRFGSYLFFVLYNETALKRQLYGYYFDDDHKELIVKQDDSPDLYEVDVMKIARDTVKSALIVDKFNHRFIFADRKIFEQSKHIAFGVKYKG
jgi:hypothetical protein